MRDVEIESEFVTLAQLLKLANLVDSGGGARHFLAETPVRVNGELDDRRGRKVRPGDVVAVRDDELRVVRATTPTR